jgi:hypothetical protein
LKRGERKMTTAGLVSAAVGRSDARCIGRLSIAASADTSAIMAGGLAAVGAWFRTGARIA